MIESSETNAHATPPAGNGSKAEQEAAQEPAQEKANNLNELNARIQELEAQVKEKENKFVYLYAEFENFKKRAIKERSDSIKFGWESVARDLLQQVDNLERAIAHTPATVEKSLVDGLNLVLSEFKSSLQRHGVQTIDCLNKLFDPNLHEAVGQEPSASPAGTITQEFGRGYTLHGRLLRPSRVVISAGQAEQKN